MTEVIDQALAGLIDRSDERDLYMKRIRQARAEGWRAGWAEGYDKGRADEGAERDRAWNEIARPISRIDPAFMSRRWAVRGQLRSRETFGRAHPGDFKGKEGAA